MYALDADSGKTVWKAPHAPSGYRSAEVGEQGAFAVTGFVLTSAGFLVMYSILPRVGATNLSLVTLVAPVSATLIGAGIFGDAIGASQMIGMALILSGLVAIDGRVWKALARGTAGGYAARPMPPSAKAC